MTEVTNIFGKGPDDRLILVVDDEFDIGAIYSMLFEFHGFRVVIAANGQQALDVAAFEPPALVVSDFMMPIMDGGELCVRWRQDKRLAAIPFILTSAGSVVDASSVPFDLFLRKPVSFDVLLQKVKQLLPPRG